MSAALEKNLQRLAESGLSSSLKGMLHGIEKEGLRVDAEGIISQTDHPASLGSTLTHSHITTDYSEALMEFITPVFNESADALQFLQDLHHFSFQKLNSEELWASSMPCRIDGDAMIPIARYGSSNVGQMKYTYRVGLEHRYGKMMQAIAGIHYNFSLPDGLWENLQKLQENNDSLQKFRSDSYFALIRNFRRYSWLLLYLFGASPALAASFMAGREHDLESWDEDTLYRPYATSLRMSDLGYSNKAQADLNICFNHLDTYTRSLQKAINTPYATYAEMGIKVDGQYKQLNSNILQIENEYYSDIRPKRVAQSGEKPINALQERGVEYIEVRNTDINPLMPLGIDQSQSDFLDAFLVTCLLSNPAEISESECTRIGENNDLTVNRGREPGLTLNNNGTQMTVAQWGNDIIADISKTAAILDNVYGSERFSSAVNQQQEKLDNPALTPSAQVLEGMKHSGQGYEAFALAKSREHREAISQLPISAEQQAYLEKLSSESLQEQKEIELADNVDFDQYLADYMAK